MIKKLLKKLFGAKQPETGSTREAARRGDDKPAAERPEHQRRGARRAEHPKDQPARQRDGAAAAASAAPEDAGKPARRRRRGGRGRGKGGTTRPAPGADGAAPVRAERAVRQQAAPDPRETKAAGGGAQPDEGAPKSPRRRRRRGGGKRPAEGSAPAAAAASDLEETRQPAAEAEGDQDLPPEPAPEADDREPRSDHARERRRRDGGAVERPPLPDLPPIPPWTPPQDPTRFAAYDLPPEVQAGIRDAGYTECTPVQAKVLPLALQGRDIAAQSQTGTGKTAAFLITVFSRLLRRGPVDGPKPRALIIAPTRELAVQIESEARNMGAHTGLSAVAIFGGVDYEKQRQALRLGADIVVGTPGRLIDFLKQGAWHTEGVEILVIDEADRMFDMGFVQDLRYILGRLPHRDRRQTMLFSATLNYSVTEVTYEYMNLPEEIRATPERMTAERAEEVLFHVARDEKPGLLLGIMEREKPERTMIFTNTKIEAEKVAKLLEHHGIRARGITGNLEQARRLKLMEEFKSGELPVMVATDVASRGLHIEAVALVVNWDLPQDPEDYVHRIGRTARAGATGKAISLADESGALNLEAIEKLIGYKIPVVWHDQDHLAEVRPGWREAAARERRERERELEARGIRPRGGLRSGPAPGRAGGSGRRPGGPRRRG
jgi:ATP-dependent RNA helicase RhlB